MGRGYTERGRWAGPGRGGAGGRGLGEDLVLSPGSSYLLYCPLKHKRVSGDPSGASGHLLDLGLFLNCSPVDSGLGKRFL